eukprot:9489861-Pyramimonas_sp.AAC.2
MSIAPFDCAEARPRIAGRSNPDPCARLPTKASTFAAGGLSRWWHVHAIAENSCSTADSIDMGQLFKVRDLWHASMRSNSRAGASPIMCRFDPKSTSMRSLPGNIVLNFSC